MGRNSSDNISGLQTHVSGMEMKTMTIADIATLWGIDAGKLLDGIQNEFELSQQYSVNSTIDDLREEYRFSPYQIMEIAERIKAALVE
jgi:uridine phosphorylase